MASTVTTAQGLSILLGKKALYSVAPFCFEVRILDAKMAYGNLRLYVQPIAGSGECWVDRSKVCLLES